MTISPTVSKNPSRKPSKKPKSEQSSLSALDSIRILEEIVSEKNVIKTKSSSSLTHKKECHSVKIKNTVKVVSDGLSSTNQTLGETSTMKVKKSHDSTKKGKKGLKLPKLPPSNRSSVTSSVETLTPRSSLIMTESSCRFRAKSYASLLSTKSKRGSISPFWEIIY
jgi:hypothetical protein